MWTYPLKESVITRLVIVEISFASLSEGADFVYPKSKLIQGVLDLVAGVLVAQLVGRRCS